jgi:hypothetical protein
MAVGRFARFSFDLGVEMKHCFLDGRQVTIIRSRCPFHGTLLEVVQEVAGVSQQKAAELVTIGAVYLGEDLPSLQAPGKVSWRRAMLLFAPGKACEELIYQGQWVRIHPEPKRFPACQTTDW